MATDDDDRGRRRMVEALPVTEAVAEAASARDETVADPGRAVAEVALVDPGEASRVPEPAAEAVADDDAASRPRRKGWWSLGR
jgi:ribonuclease E